MDKLVYCAQCDELISLEEVEAIAYILTLDEDYYLCSKKCLKKFKKNLLTIYYVKIEKGVK